MSSRKKYFPLSKIFNLHNTISGKLIILSTIFLVIFILLFGFTLQKNNRISEATNKTLKSDLLLESYINKIKEGLHQISIIRTSNFVADNKSIDKNWQSIWQAEISPAAKIIVSDNEKVEPLKGKRLMTLLDKYRLLQEDFDISIDTYRQDTSQYDAKERRFNTSKTKYFSTESAIRQNLHTLLATLHQNDTASIRRVTQAIEEDKKNFFLLLVSLALFVVCFSLSVILFLYRGIKQSVKTPEALLNKLSQGIIPLPVKPKNDELKGISNSGNQLAENLKKASDFAQKIGEGNLEADFDAVGTEDVLGNSLLQMREKLKAFANQESKRDWANKGISDINKILQESKKDLDEICSELLIYIVKYIQANQGLFFLVEEEEDTEEPYLELRSAYAWNRKKYNSKRIEFGEGLTGQAWAEQDIVYLEEIPNDYIEITSGLGKANPKSILIVPLIHNGKTFGMLELASFNLYETHHIDLLASFAEGIASSLSSIRSNEHTVQLLEKTQLQAKNISEQEASLRKKILELNEVNEAMTEKQKELEQNEQKLREMAEQAKQKEKEITGFHDQMQKVIQEEVMKKDIELNKYKTLLAQEGIDIK